jgi:hypothetical protein
MKYVPSDEDDNVIYLKDLRNTNPQNSKNTCMQEPTTRRKDKEQARVLL